MSQQYTWPPIVATTSTPFAAPPGGPIPAQAALVAGSNAGILRPLQVNATGELAITAAVLPLPTGAATEATQLNVLSAVNLRATEATQLNVLAALGPLATEATLLDVLTALGPLATQTTLAAAAASLVSIDTKLTAPLSVTGPLTDAQLRASPVPVSAASLPLPTGAATEATLLLVRSDTSGILADTAAIEASVASIDGKLNSLGQKAMAGSVPVVIASDQSAIPVSVSGTAAGRQVTATVRNVYSVTPVTTGAWVELISSLSNAVNELDIFDSSGETLEIGLGAPSSEARLILVYPGGNGRIPVAIASGQRVSIRAVSATANVGEIVINLLR